MMDIKLSKKWIFLILMGGGILFLGLSEIDEKKNDEKKGLVTYIDGQVKRSSVNQENWENAPVNTEILSGDKVRTYRQSRAELDLAKLDIIRLAPRTIIDVVKLYEETKDKKIKTSIKLEEGELWASVHQIDVDTEFDISAPIAAAAITGTTLRMKVDEDTTTQVKVYEGEVEVKKITQQEQMQTQPRSLAPQEIPGPQVVPGPKEVSLEEWIEIVKAMQQITIDKNGKVVSFGDFSLKDKDEKTSWINWNKKRDQDWLKQN
jgi:hypothetical protein